MKKIFQLSLGIMTALGGFVDIGELVFTSQAGARFGYSLLWSLVLGTIGIIGYSEMCGRIAAVRQTPVFSVVKARLGKRLGFVTLVASNLVNILTCAAELGGCGLVVQLLTGWPYHLSVLFCAAAIGLLVWFLPFKWEERFFGLLGLTLLIYGVAAIRMGPDWSLAARSVLPNIPSVHGSEYLLYAYFVVGIISAVMMPYEVYFYSSGGIEEDWTPKDLPENTFISAVGMTLGGALTASLLFIGARFFGPRAIYPEMLGTVALGPTSIFGRTGFLLAMAGIFFAVSGSTVETALSGAYNIAQFHDWKWGRKYKANETPKFTITWVLLLAGATAMTLVGIDPVKLVEYAVMFAVIVLPLTYYPILSAARDRSFLGKHVNARWQTALGWFYFILITLCSLAAIPLMLLTHLGEP